LTVTKTVSVATSTLPTSVDYKVVISNGKTGGPVYDGLLTDTLRDPAGGILFNRTWNLGTIEPGDDLILTYTVEYAATSTPGTYVNTARVTGHKLNPASAYSVDMEPVAATGNVKLTAAGLVLGVSTSTAVSVCQALLTKTMGPGRRNDVGEVKKLQAFLAQDSAIYPQGVISGHYGPLTVAAVKRFQEKYAADVLRPAGLQSGTGYAGAYTIKKINELECGGLTPSGNAETESLTPATTAPMPRSSTAPTSTSKPAPKDKDVTEEPARNGLLGGAGKFFSKLRW